jgi:hypothetical protein
MTRFKELFHSGAHHRHLASPSVTAQLSEQQLELRFDSKDIVVEASYFGKVDPWLGSLCEMLPGKTLHELSLLDQQSWEKNFPQDESYWDFRSEMEHEIFFPALEVLKLALDLYRGREYLYRPTSPLLCRCFGVREDDVLNFLKSEKEPDLEKLSAATKAGMGCRSCVPQLKRWLAIHSPAQKRFFKEKSYADWLLQIDELLKHFPLSKDWNLQVEGLKNNQVIISYDKDVSQKEEEIVTGKLQGFLASGTDPDFGFFLRRSRQR